jgi:drug/metabolite transporter (DMT)-like permease
VCIKVLVDAVSPVVMVAVSFGLGAVVLRTMLALRGGRLPARGIIWLHLLIMALIANMVPFLLIAWGSQHADATLAAVMNGSTPIFALFFAIAVFRDEVLTLARVSGILLGFAGVIALTGGSLRTLGSTATLSVLALVLASVCYGFAFAYARQFVKGDALANVTCQLVIGFAISAPIALTTGWVRIEHLHTANVAAWIILGIFGNGIAFLFYYSLIRQIGATHTSLITYITPVFGVILSWILLNENLGTTGITGMLLIFAGAAINYGWHNRLRPHAGGREP